MLSWIYLLDHVPAPLVNRLKWVPSTETWRSSFFSMKNDIIVLATRKINCCEWFYKQCHDLCYGQLNKSECRNMFSFSSLPLTLFPGHLWHSSIPAELIHFSPIWKDNCSVLLSSHTFFTYYGLAVKTPTNCASGKPAVLSTLSSESNGWAPPLQSCWGRVKSSQSFPSASCCACCRRRGWASRPTVGKELPGRQTSLCRLGWADLDRWMSYTWTSRGPWSSVRSALHMYLGKKPVECTVRGDNGSLSELILNVRLTKHTGYFQEIRQLIWAMDYLCKILMFFWYILLEWKHYYLLQLCFLCSKVWHIFPIKHLFLL